MGYDALIDSAKHNAALTAMADAIRAKSGSTAKIPWVESKGFADNIVALSKVATGTFTPSYDSNGTVTISGLGFKPSNVILFLASPDDSYCEGDIIFAYYNGNSTMGVYNYADHYYYESEDEETGETYEDCSADGYIATADDFAITANDDGFTAVSSGNWGGQWRWGFSYRYFAF